MNVSEIVKLSLAYPRYDLKNVVIMAGFFILSAIFLFIGIFLFLSSLSDNTLVITESMGFWKAFNAIITHIPIACQLLFVVFIICSILTLVFVSGYIYRIYEKTVTGSKDNPEFDNFKSLFVQGLKVIVVNIGYNIIPLILAIVITILGYNNLGVASLIVAIIHFVVSLIVFFTCPIAIASLAENAGNLKSAFKFKNIFETIKSIGAGKYIGTIIFAQLIASILTYSFIVIQFFVILFSLIFPPVGLLVMLIFLVLNGMLFSYLLMYLTKINALLFNERKYI